MSALKSVVLVGLGLWAGSNLAFAASTLTYQSTDLADVVVGEDLWQNVYTFAGALEEFGGLTVHFDSALHANLDVTVVPLELSAVASQPDPLLGVEGLVGLTALSAQPPTYTANFTVAFVSTGAVPKTQPYEVFAADFSILEPGTAIQTPVPEPASALMLGLGSLALLALRRRHTSI